ncbi:hypothetical protein SARC_07468 [Sphaeroforma arctica JP610]|uniref:Uncharacterized protein n=1 Tax=Sphaeroforma arctica JP610 TaxID=667725 RepID=A0A0L0FUD2_9EUKA|nr:hypothetical protein SARC_07468 [Sphaeroforma arctica JP610]KNC80166.1 hypothetical protein SARC_07468 [Sphaeroforma arctica JP610]|eukprot:XP_014154068.1 hypothetical protein SARC_07468 [Sphaeroforma arctica JP610]
MSALEMMDKKMDAGLAFASDDNRILSVDDALRRKLIKTSGFTPAERVGIMDEAYAHLVTWLKGHSLAQTVYECVYLHRPSMLQDEVLATFFVSFERVIVMILEIVQQASIYHEEDFQVRNITLQSDPLNPDQIPSFPEAFQNLLNLATQMVSRPDEDVDSSVSCRLSFLAHFMASLHTIAVPAHPSEYEQTRALHTNILDQCERELQHMLQTRPFGVQREGEGYNVGFVPALAYTQLSPGPAVVVSVASRAEGVVYLDGLMKRLRVAFNMPRPANKASYHSNDTYAHQDTAPGTTHASTDTNTQKGNNVNYTGDAMDADPALAHGGVPLLVWLRRFMAAFNSLPQSCCLSRSIVYGLLLNEGQLMGSVSVPEAIKEEVNSYIESPYLYHARHYAEGFVGEKDRMQTQTGEDEYPQIGQQTALGETTGVCGGAGGLNGYAHAAGMGSSTVPKTCPEDTDPVLRRRAAVAEAEADRFFARLHQPMVNLTKIGCFNKAREHRVLAHKLRVVSDWQVDADKCDARINLILRGVGEGPVSGGGEGVLRGEERTKEPEAQEREVQGDAHGMGVVHAQQDSACEGAIGVSGAMEGNSDPTQQHTHSRQQRESGEQGECGQKQAQAVGSTCKSTVGTNANESANTDTNSGAGAGGSVGTDSARTSTGTTIKPDTNTHTNTNTNTSTITSTDEHGDTSIATEGTDPPFTSYLGSWVLSVKLEMMERYLIDGIRLDLFLTHELGVVYLYLDYIYGWQVSTKAIATKATQDTLQARRRERQERRDQVIAARNALKDGNEPISVGKETGVIDAKGEDSKKDGHSEHEQELSGSRAKKPGQTGTGKKKKKKKKKSGAASTTAQSDGQATSHAPDARQKTIGKVPQIPTTADPAGAESKAALSDEHIRNLIVEVKQALARAFARLFEGLRGAERVQLPLKYFAREEVRYFHRFEPFMYIRNPEFLEWAYLESNMTYNTHPAKVIFENAIKLFSVCAEHLTMIASTLPAHGSAKPNTPKQTHTPTHADTNAQGNTYTHAHLTEINQLLQVAKNNAVVARLLAAGHRAPEEPTMDFSVNSDFPQLIFPRKKTGPK